MKKEKYSCYGVYNMLPSQSSISKGLCNWYLVKYFVSKRSCLNFIKRYKEKNKNSPIACKLVWQVIAYEVPFPKYEDGVIVYSEV